MACARIEVKTVKLLQLLYSLQRCLIEGTFAIEGVEHNALQEITEGEVVVLREGLQYFQQALFHPNPSLYPLDNEGLIVSRHVYQCTMVPIILATRNRRHSARDRRRTPLNNDWAVRPP